MPQEKPKNPFKSNIDEYNLAKIATSGIITWHKLANTSLSLPPSRISNLSEATTLVQNKIFIGGSRLLKYQTQEMSKGFTLKVISSSNMEEGWGSSIITLSVSVSTMN